MQFYDSTKSNNAICQEIDRLCDSTDTSYPRLDKTARVNSALETVIGWIINADGTWQFDDSNYTTTPRGVGDLSSGQHMYTFVDKFLQLEEIDILGTDGIYRRLTPFDPSESTLSFEETFGITYNGTTYTAPTGFPQYYDKQSNVIRFDKAPTSSYVTLSKGLRAIFKRTGNLFTAVSTTVADTTVPGFDSQYHIILAYMASIPYCMTYKKDRVNIYNAMVGDTYPRPTGLKRSLLSAYSKKEKDKRQIMSGKKIIYI